VDCAYGLGVAFGEAAKAEADHARQLELFEAFNRGFLAVRMGIRLCMSLRAPPKPARAEAVERDPPETDGADRAERDPGDGAERERERERDQEPVSLPKFLSTLRGVAADAARLDLPADLRAGAATLQDLLARAKADAAAPVAARPTGGVDLLTRPPKAAPRTALLGSASAGVTRPIIGRSTGPPHRRSG